MSLKLLSEFLRQFRHRFCRPSLLCHYFSNYSYTTLRATIHIQQIAAAAIASEESAAAGQGGRREESERARAVPSPADAGGLLLLFLLSAVAVYCYGLMERRESGRSEALLRSCARRDTILVSCLQSIFSFGRICQ